MFEDIGEIVKREMVLFLLIDQSGSMYGTKIGAVNTAIREVLPELNDVGGSDAHIKIATLIFSNGCHWIDHFLFMNDYSRPVKIGLERLSNSDSVSTVELENGACLCLHLTHHGSPRIGVQDKITMRCEKRTVTVVNGSSYEFEDEVCMRRKYKKNRMNAYQNMYKSISDAIVKEQQGDSREMLEYTNNVILTLDKLYLEQSQEPEK